MVKTLVVVVEMSVVVAILAVTMLALIAWECQS
jgi:hypothetical protein